MLQVAETAADHAPIGLNNNEAEVSDLNECACPSERAAALKRPAQSMIILAFSNMGTARFYNIGESVVDIDIRGEASFFEIGY